MSEIDRRYEQFGKVIARQGRDLADLKSLVLARLLNVGASIGVWTTWTPSYTNLTPGTGSDSIGRYTQIGDTIIFYWQVTLGTTPTVGDVRVSLPVTSISYATQTVIGQGSLVDDSGGFTHVGYGRAASTTTMQVVSHAQATARHAALSSTSPFTWAVSDRMIVLGQYEAA